VQGTDQSIGSQALRVLQIYNVNIAGNVGLLSTVATSQYWRDAGRSQSQRAEQSALLAGSPAGRFYAVHAAHRVEPPSQVVLRP
jgi:hypothetical protein